MRHSTRNSVDEREIPFVDIADLSLQHRHVVRRGFVVKVNDEGQRVGLVEEEFVVVVLFDHVADLVVVSVHAGVVPPRFFGWLVGRRMDGNSHGQGRGQHQTKTQQTEHGSLHRNRSVASERLEGFQGIGLAATFPRLQSPGKIDPNPALNG